MCFIQILWRTNQALVHSMVSLTRTNIVDCPFTHSKRSKGLNQPAFDQSTRLTQNIGVMCNVYREYLTLLLTEDNMNSKYMYRGFFTWKRASWFIWMKIWTNDPNFQVTVIYCDPLDNDLFTNAPQSSRHVSIGTEARACALTYKMATSNVVFVCSPFWGFRRFIATYVLF